MKEENNYDISFFKPTSDFSKKNRNLVLYLVVIWAVGVFGFQVLLKAVERPTPEAILTEYLQVKDQVFTNQSSANDKQVLLKALVNIANKNTVNTKNEQPVINKAINWTAGNLLVNRPEAKEELVQLKTAKADLATLSDLESYKTGNIKLKNLQIDFLKKYNEELAITPNGIRGEIFMSTVNLEDVTALSEEEIAKIPVIMNKYLIHNRSFLTDTTFLGFPFHYFYTAVFLLILFIALCYVYAIKVDRLNKKFGIVE